MPRPAHFEWEGTEYEHSEKSADWYWALGILATAGVIASLLFGNLLLIVLILIAAVAIALHAMKRPPVHRFTLTDHGLIIGSDLHPYESMRSFSILEHVEGTEPPLLSIKTESWFTPHLTIPLAGVDADALFEHMLAHVDEAEHRTTVVDVVAAWMGF